MTTKNKSTKSTKPAFIAYQVREGKDEKGYFNRIGIAFSHSDGKGFNLLIDALPLDGRITLRVPSEKSAETDPSK
ncbi:hypothetical protein [Fimbriiglobus ruber]|uniref:Uncharacterized protein n=1 Tax=Fimbriiglobus ruber TaxID=1908690 RepID=A0A225E8R2_9BACT|nr:hypothetical protein [Fimbriiglobus ruber]OWK46466.1 hypothetical protein FRUB_00165 [Fimbriiglobus ruber]